MMEPTRWPRRAVILGMVLMLLGVIDPLEGSIIVALGAALIAAGGFLAHARYRRSFYLAFGLVLAGVLALWGMSAQGGVGGDTGRSPWWLLIALPYPAGWLLGLFAATRQLRAGFGPASQQ